MNEQLGPFVADLDALRANVERLLKNGEEGIATGYIPPLIAEVERLHGEVDALRNERIVSAIFASRDEDCPLPFALLRDNDVTGVSGEGVVAYGVQFADGTVVIRWLGEYASTVLWDSLDKAMHVHGHRGSTRVMWLAERFLELAAVEACLGRLLIAARGVLTEFAETVGPEWLDALRGAVESIPDEVLAVLGEEAAP